MLEGGSKIRQNRLFLLPRGLILPNHDDSWSQGMGCDDGEDDIFKWNVGERQNSDGSRDRLTARTTIARSYRLNGGERG